MIACEVIHVCAGIESTAPKPSVGRKTHKPVCTLSIFIAAFAFMATPGSIDLKRSAGGCNNG